MASQILIPAGRGAGTCEANDDPPLIHRGGFRASLDLRCDARERLQSFGDRTYRALLIAGGALAAPPECQLLVTHGIFGNRPILLVETLPGEDSMADSSNFALHRPELSEALFRGEEKIKRLMGRDVLELADDTVLIEADKAHDYVYRMRHGWAGRVRTLADGRAQFIIIFLPGDLFAVKSMFVSRHPDAVQLLSRSVVERISYRDLQEAYANDPDVALRCTWQIVEEERRLHNWVVGLGVGSAEERIAMLFSEFRGRLILSGTIARDALTFQLPITQEQLADHLGITSVHVSRVLKVFRDAGVIELKSKLLTIRDPEALSDIARPLQDVYERTTPAFSGT